MNRRTLLTTCAVLFLTSALRAQSGGDLRSMLGQMIMSGFVGTTAPDSLLEDLGSRNLGGVIVMTGNGNLVSPTQIQQLTAQLRGAAHTPPFIAVDQEGGFVARLNGSNGFAPTLSAYTLGTVYASVDSTAKQAALMAGWLSTSGMNVNFAPVADVNVNPNSPAIGHYGRSFSADPRTVADHCAAFIDAFHAHGIVTSLKHFPGHGSAGTDSHLTLPDITDTWSPAELIPYTTLLGSNRIDMVMAGHLFNASIDSVYPSSISHATIQGLLRDSLGYQGVVITDDLYNMAAITDNFGFFEAAEHAVNAGVDILLYVSNTYNGGSLCRQLVDTLAACVERGTIPRSRIEESYARILSLKARYQITGVPRLLTHARPAGFDLSSYPNPFNPSTTIRLSVASFAPVSVRIYDLLGRVVATLLDGMLPAGVFETRWNASGMAAGVYLCRVQVGGEAHVVRLVLVK